MSRLDEIKAREAKATKGPWEVFQVINRKGVPMSRSYVEISTPCTDVLKADDYRIEASADDMDFISDSREDIPWLISEVERLRGVIKEAEYSGLGGPPHDAGFACPWCQCDEKGRHFGDCEAFTRDGDVK